MTPSSCVWHCSTNMRHPTRAATAPPPSASSQPVTSLHHHQHPACQQRHSTIASIQPVTSLHQHQHPDSVSHHSSIAIILGISLCDILNCANSQPICSCSSTFLFVVGVVVVVILVMFKTKLMGYGWKNKGSVMKQCIFLKMCMLVIHHNLYWAIPDIKDSPHRRNFILSWGILV